MKLTQEQEERVRALADENGRLTPAMVVDDARDKRSPLHDLFEWDKGKAALAHWLDQARIIIGAVRVVVTNETTTIKAPLYVRDPDATGQGYRSVVNLRSDPDKARESLIYTLAVASGHLRRAYELAESLGLQMEVDGLLERVSGLQRSLKQAA
jgi:hypothetical protein